ncbi:MULTISPECIES: type III polyketide synthase [unclassified Solwaraspora]|uniref:type III polyketide synthase n=1 Tax=unclassified Solwaraspora TaxID=2627926 RepID=UPI00248B26E8|nr:MULTISPECIES: type III polyketide synthase [unclassified Solwaraspora]WBB97367.1 type III polyketide synthase [Solwaraspora sp. WMMA2059]WBC18730.1 type III polyketide synthase [Solwaraspora sp. WMMA2080]WJK33863.1 type III polyketide synthase [Solwaraspora sp. WMMA2065]
MVSRSPEPVAGRSSAAVVGLGLALPPSATQDELWRDFFAARYDGGTRALAERIFANSGVRTRQAAVSPLLEDVADWPTERRMRRYQIEALPLGKEAVHRALTQAGLTAGEIGLFVVCSCTGYATPGLDIILARDVGMAADTQRLFVGHMGCYAALPGLGAAADFVTARGRPALLLCAELTSLHIQPPARRVDTQQIVAHALFSDAAAAVVLVPTGRAGGPPPPGGYAVREVVSATDASTADHMTWEVTDLGFRMGLSPRVPQVLSVHVRALVGDLLARHGLTVSQVDGWAVHPGGPRILNVVQRELGLSDAAMSASRETLAAYGNCSSPTVLLILDRLRRAGPPPRHVVMLAFGPGLTLYAALLGR